MTGTMRGAGVLLISGRSFAKGRPKGVYMSLLHGPQIAASRKKSKRSRSDVVGCVGLDVIVFGFGLPAGEDEHRFISTRVGLGGVFREERALAWIGGGCAPGGQFEAGLIKVRLSVGLPAFVVVRRCRWQHPLAVVERVGLDPGMLQPFGLRLGPRRVGFARHRFDQSGRVNRRGLGWRPRGRFVEPERFKEGADGRRGLDPLDRPQESRAQRAAQWIGTPDLPDQFPPADPAPPGRRFRLRRRCRGGRGFCCYTSRSSGPRAHPWREHARAGSRRRSAPP